MTRVLLSDTMDPFGLSGDLVNYIVYKLGMAGICECVGGIFWVPKTHSDLVYEEVKDYRLLKARVAHFNSTGELDLPQQAEAA